MPSTSKYEHVRRMMREEPLPVEAVAAIRSLRSGLVEAAVLGECLAAKLLRLSDAARDLAAVVARKDGGDHVS